MTKQFLPYVTIETIQEIGQEALADKDKFFKEMAIANPELYRFAYEMHQRKETNKSTMLGVLVAVYAALERQGGKGKKDKRRLRHAQQNGDGRL